jgi:hypothetical protein
MLRIRRRRAEDDRMQAQQPGAGLGRGVGPDRRAAAGLERGEQAALGGHGGAGRLVVDLRQQAGQLGVALAALDGERALAGRRDHVLGLEDLGHQVGVPDPGQPRVGQHHRVELALADPGQPGVGVSADRHAGDVGAQHRQLGRAARRAGADPRSRGQVGQLATVPAD